MPNWLLRQALISPDKLALEASGEKLTFRQLSSNVDALAQQLLSIGVSKGMRVGILIQDPAGFAQGLHALTRVGAVAVPLNIKLPPGDIRFRLSESSCTALLFDKPL